MPLRFVIDNSLSPLVAGLLRGQGFDAVHVREIMDPRSPDSEIFDFATGTDRIIVAADVDFGELLAVRNTSRPSVVLLRRRGKSAVAVFGVISKNLRAIQDDLVSGANVVIEDARIRVRRLPLSGA